MTCNHPLDKLNIWRCWTTFFNQETVKRSTMKIVVECECGHRGHLENEIGDPNPI